MGLSQKVAMIKCPQRLTDVSPLWKVGAHLHTNENLLEGSVDLTFKALQVDWVSGLGIDLEFANLE